MSSRLKKLTAASLLFAACASVAWGTFPGSLIAAGDTRTLSLYHVHTKESLTITYKKNGRYLPSALEKVNQVLRDWRRNEIMKIDPKTIDLMWELHADLGSSAPIHIVSGYRSAATNAMLKKIGRNVAKQSMHIRGKAIDLYFPDIPVSKLRGSAIVRQVGGVGFYPRSGSSGFVHLDSGNVRYWPRPSENQLAQIMKDYRKTMGARMTNGYLTAQTETEPSVSIVKSNDKVELAAAMVLVEDDEADAPVAAATEKPAELVLLSGYPVPRPRPKPIEVLMLAAAKMRVEPASAPPPRTNFAKRKPTAENTSTTKASEIIFEAELSTGNPLAKGNFAFHARHDQIDLVTASAGPATSADDFFWWPTRWLFDTNSAVRRDAEETVAITFTEEDTQPQAAVQKASAAPWGLGDFIAVLQGINSGDTPSEKSDRLMVNRAGKADIQPDSQQDPARSDQIDALLDASVRTQSFQ